jgi:hypothetical protein
MDQHENTIGSHEPLLVTTSEDVLSKYNKVAEELGLKFQRREFYLESIQRTVVWHYRPPEKLARWLFLRPSTHGKIGMRPAPRVVQRPDGSPNRVYESFTSGKWMEQVAPLYPQGANILALMESYDKTHLDLQGSQKAFGHYWVANGLHESEKQKMSNWWVWGLRPIIMTNKKTKPKQKSKLTEANQMLRAELNRQIVLLMAPLATDGMDVVSWDESHVEKVYAMVSNTVVDGEEAVGVADTRPGHGDVPYRNCTDCLLPTMLFNDGRARAAHRTIASEKSRIQGAQQLHDGMYGRGGAGAAERVMQAFGNYMRDNPLWEMPNYGMPGQGPYSATSWAQMHQFYKGQFENVVRLVFTDLMGQVYGEETAVVWRLHIEDWVMTHGVAFPTITEYFPDGFKNFEGWDKRHWAALMRVLRCALHGVFEDGQPLAVLGRLMEWFSIAKLDIHTDDTLALQHEILWPEYCDARNELLQHLDVSGFNKYKGHMPRHLKEKVEAYGVINGQNDEGGETAHKDNLKENWRNRNNKRPLEQQQQIANNLEACDTARALQEMHRHHVQREAHAGAPMARCALEC